MEHENFRGWVHEWFERFIGRFDSVDKSLKVMTSRHNIMGGERLLDNQDLCELLHVSFRTLHRYRSTGELKYHMIYHKVYYKEGDVERFIQEHFKKKRREKDGEEGE